MIASPSPPRKALASLALGNQPPKKSAKKAAREIDFDPVDRSTTKPSIQSISSNATKSSMPKATKSSAVKDSGKLVEVEKSAKKAAPETKAETEPKPKTTRELQESDWTYNEDERIYVLEPQRPDVHKYTLVYCHYLCGHPTDYFEVKGFETQGLRVVLPKAPVLRSLHYGEGKKTSRTRIWYDYYYDPKDPNEDPKDGADAEELDLDSDEEAELLEQGEGEEEEGDGDDEDAGKEEEDGDAKGGRLQGFQDWLDGEKKKSFSEFIKTISTDTHPEIEIPKEAQVKKSIDRILALIHKEAAVLGGDYSRIYLGGWSQGATLALNTAIHKDCPSLGGILSITGTFHVPRVEAAIQQPVKTTPFCMYVGIKDDTYPLMLLHPMVEKLRAVGFKIDLREKDMGHNLNGRVGGKASLIEERWIKQYIETIYQESSLGSFLKMPSAPLTLDEMDYEAAMKVVYGLLFTKKKPHNRKYEIMNYSVTEDPMADMHRRVAGLSSDEFNLVAKLLGATSCTPWDLSRFLATPTATDIARIRAAVAPAAFG